MHSLPEFAGLVRRWASRIKEMERTVGRTSDEEGSIKCAICFLPVIKKDDDEEEEDIRYSLPAQTDTLAEGPRPERRGTPG